MDEHNPAQRSDPDRRHPLETQVTGEVELVERVSALIEQARESIASYANATLTMTYWRVGAIIDTEVLGSRRADYGEQIVASLARQLTERFGRGFEEKNLRRMIKFA